MGCTKEVERARASGLSRRLLLAGLAVVGIPTALPASAAAAVDPIFAAIEVHKKAKAAMDAAWAEVGRLGNLAEEKVGPRWILAPNMVTPGCLPEQAGCTVDIDRIIPPRAYPELNAKYQEEFRRCAEAWDAIAGKTDEITDEPCDAYWLSIDDFIDTVPTTMAGLLAMIHYAAEIEEQEPDAFTRGNPLAAMAEAVTVLIGGAA